MATEVERLTVSLEASITKFDRTMAKALALTNQRTKQIETRFQQVDKQISSFGVGVFKGFASGALTALAPILSVSAAIRTAQDAMNEFDRIAKAAKAGGLDAESYQELSYAMDLGGVATDQWSKALETFAKNTGLAAVGKGRLISQLKALNPELLANLQATTDQEKRLRLVADALDKETDASKKAAIANALFGEAGAKMVDALKGGSAALDETARKARELGIVIDRDLIANAEELNDQFSTAQRVIDLQFKQALIGLAPTLISTMQLIGELARSINVLLDQMRSVEERTFIRPLQNELIGLENRITTLKQEIASDEANSWASSSENPFASLFEIGVGAKKKELEDLYQTALKLQDRIAQLQGMGSTPPAKTTETEIDIPDSGASTRDGFAEALQRIRDQITALGLQEQALFQTTREQEKARIGQDLLNEARKAGITIDKAVLATIDQVASAYADQAVELEQTRERLQAIGDTATDIWGRIVDGAYDGKDAISILIDEVSDLSKEIIKLAGQSFIKTLLGQPVSGGLLGGSIIPGILHGGGFAGIDGYGHGRSVPAAAFAGAKRYHSGGGPGLRADEVPAILQKGELVLPKNARFSGGAGTVNVSFSSTVDARGSTMTEGQFTAVLAKNNEAMRKEIPTIVRKAALFRK